MDLRHQSSAISIIMLEGEDTHPLSATKVAKNLPATFPVTKNNHQTTHNSHYPSRPVKNVFKAAMI